MERRSSAPDLWLLTGGKKKPAAGGGAAGFQIRPAREEVRLGFCRHPSGRKRWPTTKSYDLPNRLATHNYAYDVCNIAVHKIVSIGVASVVHVSVGQLLCSRAIPSRRLCSG